MARKYSLIKRWIQAVPGLREALAAAFTWLPKPLSIKAYAALRKYVFRDNQPRMAIFQRAFEEIKKHGLYEINYFEFGVARGTSVISSYMTAKKKRYGPENFCVRLISGLAVERGSGLCQRRHGLHGKNFPAVCRQGGGSS